MAHCSRCKKFILLKTDSGYCKECDVAVKEEEARRKAEEERFRKEEDERLCKAKEELCRKQEAIEQRKMIVESIDKKASSERYAFHQAHKALSAKEQHAAIMKEIEANGIQHKQLPGVLVNLPWLDMMFQFVSFRVEGFPDKPEFLGYAHFKNSHGDENLLSILRPDADSDMFDVLVLGTAAGIITQDECWEIMSFGACRWKVLVGEYPEGFSSASQRHPHYVEYDHSRDKDFYPGSLRYFE